ncbi:MAG TPA: hypothetical protein VMV34_02790 [Terriglobia bacterium]|nr:hypothetical protein [Terriglobia bacterium]
MSSTLPTHSAFAQPIRGRIIESEVKISVDPAEPLPLACALYAIETQEGIWLCAYYGKNRSVFDYLPQKDAMVDEGKLGIAFHSKELVSKEQFKPEVWEDFKKRRFMSYGGPGG